MLKRYYNPASPNGIGMLISQPNHSGRGAARLARLHGVQEVGGSNPLAPTNEDSRNGVFCFYYFLFHNVILSREAAKNPEDYRRDPSLRSG